VLGTLVATPAQAHGKSVITVRPGQSIQAAVDKAAPGTTIVLKRGTFRESVLIQKDHITIRGSGSGPHGTVLIPPKTLPKNLCTDFVSEGAGFCVIAKKLDAKGNVVTRVFDTKITNLKVTGFKGMGIVAFGAARFVVTHVAAINDGEYGIARFDTIGGALAHNVARNNDEAGLYVGDTARANAVVFGNLTTGNQLGLFIRHARFVKVFGNTSYGNCQGMLILDDGEAGGAGNVVAFANKLNRNNKFCPASEDAPPLQGGGLLVLGGTKNLIAKNVVLGNAGKQFNSGGIVLLSAKMFGGVDAAHNLVVKNVAFKNRPADIRWDGKGVGNRFIDNKCKTSIPKGLCGHH
jgi:hypothetical protein